MTKSPCINVCRMHAGSGWCEGCLRTLDEIAAWSVLDEGAKQAVVRQLPQRRQLLQSALDEALKLLPSPPSSSSSSKHG